MAALSHREGAGDPPAPSRVLTRREVWLRQQRRRAALIAGTSMTLVIAAVVLIVPRTPGWPTVKKTFFNGARFRQDFPDLLGYLWTDVKLFLTCVPFILIWGVALAMMRNIRNPALFPLRAFAAAYTDLFRGIPVILTIYLVGFGIPALGLKGEFHLLWFGGRWNSAYLWGPVALILAYSAYVAEVFRSGIEGIHESQRAGARSLGLTQTQTMRHVVLPQAARRVVPPLMNDMLSLQKDVALLSLLGVYELFRRAQVIKDRTFNYTPYVVAAVIFLILTIPETRLVDWYSARHRRRTGGSQVA